MQVLTQELVSIVRDRAQVFVREMPVIQAHFDNGVHQGIVEVCGYDWDARRAMVKVEGRNSQHADGRYRVQAGQLTVDEATYAHLTRALMVAKGPGVTGRYSAGVQHFRGGSIR